MIEIAVRLPRLFAEGAGNLQLTVALETGSLTAIVGPSGSGKTTLLRVLAGLEKPSEGRLVVADQVWFDAGTGINLAPQQRSIGYVFQDTALFPNLTVRENITYAAPREQRERVDELIETTGLGAFINQKPSVLSGGQRQRVALARALIRRPSLLLLDEPFAALDTEAAGQLRQVLLTLHRAWGTTTVLVSHHAADVQAMADRIIQLVQGRIQVDQINVHPAPSALPSMAERIKRIWFDQASEQWVIETDTVQLRSANPAWSELRAGLDINLSWG